MSSSASCRGEFRGSGSEYFRIWIVNVALSILTLGFYLPWAKVRSRRYFCQNTYVLDQNFDYHADPVKILKGHIILLAIFLAYALSREYPWLSIVGLLGAALLPWLMVRGLIFSLSNTSFNGIRFGFDRDYKGAYLSYGRAILFSILSLGLLVYRFPLWFRRFTLPRTRYGRARFEFESKGLEYDVIFLKALFLYVGAVVLLIALGFLGTGLKDSSAGETGQAIFLGLVVASLYLTLGVVVLWVRARLMGFFLPRTRLGNLRFQADYSAFELVMLTLKNILACLFTLGLAWPWAAVRMARYKAEGLRVVGRPDDFLLGLAAQVQTASDSSDIGATGSELMGFWDIDIGF